MAANNSLVTYSVIGQSYEGRDIGQVAVRTGSPGVKQIIFLECCVHAREWITESTCIWIFDQVGQRINQKIIHRHSFNAQITNLKNIVSQRIWRRSRNNSTSRQIRLDHCSNFESRWIRVYMGIGINKKWTLFG